MMSLCGFRLLPLGLVGVWLCGFLTKVATMPCDLRPCVDELVMHCPYGLQRDRTGCTICACRPAPGRLLCSSMLCNMLCVFMPDQIHICPICPCARYNNPEPKGKQHFLYGASPEHVDAALTGQIDLTSAYVVDRHDGMCYTTASRRWRTADGTCNNVWNYGSTFMPVARLLPAVYDDGQQSPRTRSAGGGKLPSARQVSRQVHGNMVNPSSDGFTAMFMQFGQFIDHDITSFPLPTERNHTIRCCDDKGRRIEPPPHRDCFPIDLEGDSHFYPRTCMEFVRSIPARNEDGQPLFPRENINAVTAFVDGSAIYGSSEEHMRRLRVNDGRGIYLKTSTGSNLPNDNTESCVKRMTSDPCFVAGDDRVNEQPGLTAIHTVFLRQHNLIASSLRNLLPHEDDEGIFQRSRAILGAMLQNILYGQWLSLVLGPDDMYRYGLETGHDIQHNPDIDPRISNVFSTAAFRFGHSMIPAVMALGQQRTARMRDLFNKPFEVVDNLYQVIFGLINGQAPEQQRAQRVDRHFVSEITNHLFQPRDQPLRALDLVALNIQRGRDHGLPPFNTFRRACSLGSLTSFQHASLGETGRHLEQVYSDVEDIDMFTGIMAEETGGTGGVVGPTVACILARQFHALKYGDRFFFEAWRGSNGWNAHQVRELRKATVAWVLCNTLPFARVQQDVFRVAAPSNPVLTCDEVKARGPDIRVLAGKR